MIYLCRQNEAIYKICKDSDGNEDKKCSTFY